MERCTKTTRPATSRSGPLALLLALGIVAACEEQVSQPALDRPEAASLHHVTFAGRILTGRDANGGALWDYTAGSDVTTALVADLDHDGALEAIYGTDRNGVDKAQVVALDGDGMLLWSQRTGASHWWPDGEMRVVALRVADIDADGTMEVVVKSEHHYWFPERIAVLNAGGIFEGDYWNPGRASGDANLRVADLDGDEVMEIIVGSGNNNAGNSAVVYCLSGRSLGAPLWYANLGRPHDATYPYVSWVEVVDDVTGDAVQDIKCGGGAMESPAFTRYLDGATGAPVPLFLDPDLLRLMDIGAAETRGELIPQGAENG